MASATRNCCRTVLQVSRQVPVKRNCQPPWKLSKQLSRARPFSSSLWRANEKTQDQSATSGATPSSGPRDLASNSASEAAEDEVEGMDLASFDTSDLLVSDNPITANDLAPGARADYEVLPKDQQAKYLAMENHYKALSESPELEQEFHQIARQVGREVDRQENINFPNIKLRNAEVGFWADEEDDEFGRVEDDDDEVREEHITSVAESELELHREMRDYTRIAAWDMPLLTKFAKPFEVPALTSPLRFRYTTYMGESHPAAKKVVVQFCTRDLPGLTEQQRIKLIKLAGVRYNPDTDVVKMSCEKFEAPAQNKRYLGDLIGKLVKEAKDSKDTFEDVPLDFRHHKPKRAPQFPEEWKLTPERVQKLMSQRKQALLLEQENKPVSGKQLIEEYASPARILNLP